MGHYDCKGCDASPGEAHDADCSRQTVERNCTTCRHAEVSIDAAPCDTCDALDCNWQSRFPTLAETGAKIGAIRAEAEKARNSLPDDAKARTEYPMAEGLLDYFPNALAEVARLSFLATQQHHPDQPMHWDRSKSTEHADKIMRHLVDRGKLDDKGLRHSTMVAWRALALLQTELEEAEGLPPSRASRNASATAQAIH